jgi:alkanesulfonate monooxygenase SsuD/methylene tetrahydromethanopterin reductase-like flavin-dependent oxidoreductase (luciferase family)
MERGPGVAHQMLKHGLVGTADKLGERVREYIDAGIDQFFLAFQDLLLPEHNLKVLL